MPAGFDLTIPYSAGGDDTTRTCHQGSRQRLKESFKYLQKKILYNSDILSLNKTLITVETSKINLRAYLTQVCFVGTMVTRPPTTRPPTTRPPTTCPLTTHPPTTHLPTTCPIPTCPPTTRRPTTCPML
jgi:hypothetical protein